MRGGPRLIRRAHRILARTLLAVRHRLSGKKILGYIGWVGHDNLGDEAMFQAIQSLLSPCVLVPFRGNPQERLLAMLGLSGRRFFDGFVLGGGTHVNPGFWLLVEAADRTGLPMFMFGTGVGSSGLGQPDDVSLTPWESMASRFTAVGVRGPLSREALHGLGFDGIQVIGDPALGFTTPSGGPRRRRSRLDVSLAGPLPESLEAAISWPIASFQDAGGEVVGVALGEGDDERLVRQFACAGLPGLPVVPVRTDPHAYIRLVRGAECVVAGRLHAGILACAAGVPPILLAHRSKYADFAASMGLEACLVPVSEEGGAALRRVWSFLRDAKGGFRENLISRARQWQNVQRDDARGVLRRFSVAEADNGETRAVS